MYRNNQINSTKNLHKTYLYAQLQVIYLTCINILLSRRYIKMAYLEKEAKVSSSEWGPSFVSTCWNFSGKESFSNEFLRLKLMIFSKKKWFGKKRITQQTELASGSTQHRLSHIHQNNLFLNHRHKIQVKSKWTEKTSTKNLHKTYIYVQLQEVYLT